MGFQIGDKRGEKMPLFSCQNTDFIKNLTCNPFLYNSSGSLLEVAFFIIKIIKKKRFLMKKIKILQKAPNYVQTYFRTVSS